MSNFGSVGLPDSDALMRMHAGRQVIRPGQDPRIVIPPRVGRVDINLTKVGSFTLWIPATNKFILAADVLERESFSSSTWVVGLQWTVVTANYEHAVTFSPVIQWTTTTPAIRNQNISNVPHIRFFVVTAEGDADSSAQIVYAIE